MAPASSSPNRCALGRSRRQRAPSVIWLAADRPSTGTMRREGAYGWRAIDPQVARIEIPNHPCGLQELDLFTTGIVVCLQAARLRRHHEHHHRYYVRDPVVPRRVPEERIDDLRRRVSATRWPTEELVSDRSQGVQLATMQALAEYWTDEYDWRRCEAQIERAAAVHDRDRWGADPLHPCQVAARERVAADHDAWLAGLGGRAVGDGRPVDGSDRARRQAEDAFHLVLPSLPGYGFSSEPTVLGWDSGRTARAWAELMGRLDYPRYVAQGGDVGAWSRT